ncbi:MAG TPA: glycosyltransferase family 39 protein [Chromatiaceae bacterium]|nr:glycosyltransferase family 39 protein [Chromatiaceae bacterium]
MPPPASLPSSSDFPHPERLVLALIGFFLVFRLLIAATLGLGVDETYTLASARDLSLSYFDHPPLHYWLIHAMTPWLGEGRAARLPFVLLFAGSSWLLFALTRHLFGAQAGVWAVIALNLSAFYTLSGGGLVPDGPLQFCLLAAALTLARGLLPNAAGATDFADSAHPAGHVRPADPTDLVHPADQARPTNPPDRANRAHPADQAYSANHAHPPGSTLSVPSPWRTWPLAGLWLGLAGLSKYHAALFALGLLGYLLSLPSRRRLLRHPAPWVGALIALLVVSPALVWNAQHDWVSLAFQSGRGLPQGIRFDQVLANIAGQMGWILPWVFIPLVIAAWGALRRGPGVERSWFLLCLVLPTLALFTLVPLWGSRGLPHWQMPGWLMLYPLLGAWLATVARRATWPRRWALASGAALVGLVFIAVGHAATGLGRVWFPTLLAKDPTLEALEWTSLRPELQARGLLERPGLFVLAPHWITGGKLDHGLGGALPVVVFGPDQRHFAFRQDLGNFVGQDALLMGPSEQVARVLPALADYFESLEELPTTAVGRGGRPEIELRLFLGHGLRRPLPAVYGLWTER